MSHRLHVSLTTLILFAPLLLAASRPNTAARAQATRHLTVIEGSGGGDFAPGDKVRIEPYRMPDTKVFDGWDGQLPDSPAWLLSHATFFMPDRDLTVNARWLKAPLWAWEPVPGLEGVAVVHQPQLPEGLEGRPPGPRRRDLLR